VSWIQPGRSATRRPMGQCRRPQPATAGRSDVLRGLDHFRRTGDDTDARLTEAVQLVRDQQQPDGTRLLENTHPARPGSSRRRSP